MGNNRYHSISSFVGDAGYHSPLPLINKYMIALSIIISTLVLANSFPYIAKIENEHLSNKAKKWAIIVALSSVVFIILNIIELRVKGNYTYQILSSLTILTSIFYISIERRVKHKIIANLILLPLLIINLYVFFFYKNNGTYELDNRLNLVVSSEGFLGCGETIRITQNKFGLFNKSLKQIPSLCLVGITKIDVIKSTNKYTNIMIHHDGTGDSENPYTYQIEKNNEW